MPPVRPDQTTRRAVIARAGGFCEYCFSQLDYSPDPFVVEHIQPRSKGGNNQLNNLALSCSGCNGKKYDRVAAIDPLTNLQVSLYNPRIHRWSEHFNWSSDYRQLVGLTPIGRATIALLDLNRKGVVNLRLLLHQIGKHPPHI